MVLSADALVEKALSRYSIYKKNNFFADAIK